MWYAGFALGLVSSTHCVAMCGPLHIALAARARGISRFALGRVVFNLGRILTYTALGLAFGSVGALGRLVFPQQFIAVFSGFLILVLALAPWLGFKGSVGGAALSGASSRLQNQFFQWMSRTSLPGQAVTGMVNGLLPCGMVAMALAASIGMPSAAESAAFMAAFGLGTLPLLLLVSLAGRPLRFLSDRFPRLEPVIPVVLAGFLLFRGLAPFWQDQPECQHPTAAQQQMQPGMLHAKSSPDITCAKK